MSFQPVPTDGYINYSTYHVDIDIAPENIPGTSGNEFWVIAEYNNLAYDEGFPNATPSAPLAAFFRFDLYVSPTTYNVPPEVDGIDGNENPIKNTSEIYTVQATDPDGDPLVYNWTVSDSLSQDPLTNYNGIAGNPPGSLTIDFSDTEFEAFKVYDIDVTVKDPTYPPVPAETKVIAIDCLTPATPNGIEPSSQMWGTTGPLTLTISFPDPSGLMSCTGHTVTLVGPVDIPASGTQYQDATHLQATFNDLSAAPAGNYQVKVTNPSPCDINSSQGGSFDIICPTLAALSGIEPSSQVWGTTSPLTVIISFPDPSGLMSGTGHTVTLVGPIDIPASDTQYQDATHLQATFSDLSTAPAGNYQVKVTNPSPCDIDPSQGGSFDITCPTLTAPDSIVPPSMPYGTISPVTLTISFSSPSGLMSGTGHTVKLLTPSPIIASSTLYQDSTHLQATFDDLSAVEMGIYQVSVTNPEPCEIPDVQGGSFEITCPSPATPSDIAPPEMVHGTSGPVTLTIMFPIPSGLISGTGHTVKLLTPSPFTADSALYQDATHLQATFNDLSTAPVGVWQVSVANPSPCETVFTSGGSFEITPPTDCSSVTVPSTCGYYEGSSVVGTIWGNVGVTCTRGPNSYLVGPIYPYGNGADNRLGAIDLSLPYDKANVIYGTACGEGYRPAGAFNYLGIECGTNNMIYYVVDKYNTANPDDPINDLANMHLRWRVTCMQWDDSTASFGPYTELPTLSAGFSIRALAIDDLNNPIAYAIKPPATKRIFHYTGSTWNVIDGTNMPGASLSYFDMAWNPILSQYVTVYGATDELGYPITNLRILSSSGAIVEEKISIFDFMLHEGTNSPGIYIDEMYPDCRIFIWGSDASELGVPIVRYSSQYGDKKTGTVVFGGTYYPYPGQYHANGGFSPEMNRVYVPRQTTSTCYFDMPADW
jgi:hypothetical protein